MNIEIYYCTMWNYLSKASRLEDELKNNFPQANITLVKSSGGDFRVVVDDKLVFDKLAISKIDGIFPLDGEITKIIKEEYS